MKLCFNKKDKSNDDKKNLKKRFSLLKKKITSFFNKKIKNNKTKFSFQESLIFMIITFALGMLVGGVVMYGKGFFNSSARESLEEFAATYEDILNNYYKEVDAEELLQEGLAGMIDYLGDPYAAYMNKEQSEEFNETIEGEYCGIGTEILYSYETNLVTINKIFEGGPASKTDLQVGDILIEVDGESVTDKSNDEIANIVKGKKGTTVTIKVKRGEEELTFEMKRDFVDIVSVEKEIYEENNKKIGYLSLSVFADNTDEQFKDALEELENENIDSLIVDVRSNTGGYLTTVTNIISMFTEKNDKIYQLKTKDKIEVVKDKTKESRNYPVVVLADGASASASEVLAAALQETYGAKVIGTKTFGKGKVQRSYQLNDGSIVKYTSQEWLTPDGNSIDAVGVTPDIEISYIYEPDQEIDNQLRKAIEEISK